LTATRQATSLKWAVQIRPGRFLFLLLTYRMEMSEMIRFPHYDEHDTFQATLLHFGRLNPNSSFVLAASMFAASRSIFPV